MEDYDIKLQYIKGERNVLADCFSRLPRMEKATIGEKELEMIRKQKGKLINWESIKIPKTIDEIFVTETNFSVYKHGSNCRSSDWKMTNDKTTTYNTNEEVFINDENLHKCLLNLPTLQSMNNPTTLINIRNHQLIDQRLTTATTNQPQLFQWRTINETEVVVRIEGDKWKIVLPNALLNDVIRWFHLLLNHPGSTRLHDTISSRFYNNNLNRLCKNYICPDNCTMYKHQGRGHGYLPSRQAPMNPFENLQIDLIGPSQAFTNN